MLKRTRINTNKYLLADEKVVVEMFSVGAFVKQYDISNLF